MEDIKTPKVGGAKRLREFAKDIRKSKPSSRTNLKASEPLTLKSWKKRKSIRSLMTKKTES